MARPSKASSDQSTANIGFEAKLVEGIFDKAFTNTLESRTLATLRDTLLPKLLSGEIAAGTI